MRRTTLSGECVCSVADHGKPVVLGEALESSKLKAAGKNCAVSGIQDECGVSVTMSEIDHFACPRLM